MGVGVGERAETVVVFLTGGIPEGELDVLAINLDIGDVVLEDSGDIDLRGKACQYMWFWEQQMGLFAAMETQAG